MGSKCISQVSRGKSGIHMWNEEFRYRVEYASESPFLAQIFVYESHNLGADTPLYVVPHNRSHPVRGYAQFDLYHDLGMRYSGDERKWSFNLNTQGEVTISFIGS